MDNNSSVRPMDPLVNLRKLSVKGPAFGDLTVLVQGTRVKNETVVLTVHDLGCCENELMEVLRSREMRVLATRIVWVHVLVPGQESHSFDLPTEYRFPTLQEIAESIRFVLDQLEIRNVVLWGDGAGSNIALRYCFRQDPRVLGAVLINSNAGTAGFFESYSDRATQRRLSQAGFSSSLENALVHHRFGVEESKGHATNERMRAAVDAYGSSLRSGVINRKNLALYFAAHSSRDALLAQLKAVQVPLLLVVGARSEHERHTALLLSALQKARFKAHKDGHVHVPYTPPPSVEVLRVDGAISVLHEKPEKFVESFQYFLQGLGLLPSIKPVSLQTLRLEAAGDSVATAKAKAFMKRGRSVSMVEADMPIGKEGLAELEKKLTMSQSRVHSNSDGENENNNSQSSQSGSNSGHESAQHTLGPITEEAERQFLTKLDPEELASYLTKTEAEMAATGEGLTISSATGAANATRVARLERQSSNDETGRLRKVSLAVEYMYARIYQGDADVMHPRADEHAIAEASAEGTPVRELTPDAPPLRQASEAPV